MKAIRSDYTRRIICEYGEKIAGKEKICQGQ